MRMQEKKEKKVNAINDSRGYLLEVPLALWRIRK
jgi:hypothetical protein